MRLTEQVAILTALQKMVKARLDEIRRQADAELLEAYEEDGVTKKALKVGDTKVGDFTLTTEAEHWQITDRSAFEEFALDYGFATVRSTIRPECMLQAVAHLYEKLPDVLVQDVVLADKWQNLVTNAGGVPMFLDSGMVIPGLKYVPARPKGTQVRGCKPDDVAPLLTNLGGIEPLLLGQPATV